MIALVGKARLELHRLFAAQAEGLLQFQTHTDVFVTDHIQLGSGDGLGL